MQATPTSSSDVARPLRGLVLAKYGDLAASTRQRFVQAMPYLAEQNITLTIDPLFDNAYLALMFKDGTRRRSAILKAYLRRFAALRRARSYDFVIVQYELFPYLPGCFEALIALTDKPVFYDIDDAIFHQYDQHRHPIVRFFLRKKLVPLLRRVALAFCGNAYLEQYVRQYCPRTEIIPTTLDTAIFKSAANRPANAPPVVGWIGSPSTWSYCAPLLELLSSLAGAAKLSALIIGANHQAKARAGFEFRDWSEATEIEDIHQMDIGIMPMPDAPWARGKCGYKLIQYMACGIPVIASPVGVNTSIVEHGVNGLLATSEEEWRAAFETLLGDPALRQRMGEAGREHILEHYSIARYGPRLAALIRAQFI